MAAPFRGVNLRRNWGLGWGSVLNSVGFSNDINSGGRNSGASGYWNRSETGRGKIQVGRLTQALQIFPMVHTV